MVLCQWVHYYCQLLLLFLWLLMLRLMYWMSSFFSSIDDLEHLLTLWMYMFQDWIDTPPGNDVSCELKFHDSRVPWSLFLHLSLLSVVGQGERDSMREATFSVWTNDRIMSLLNHCQRTIWAINTPLRPLIVTAIASSCLTLCHSSHCVCVSLDLHVLTTILLPHSKWLIFIVYTCKLDDLLPCTMHDSSVAPSTKILPLKYGPVFTTTSDWLPRHRIVLPATVKATFCYSFHFSPLNCLNCWFLPLSTVNLYYYSFSPCWRRDFPSLSLSAPPLVYHTDAPLFLYHTLVHRKSLSV